MSDTVLVERDGGVATVVMNRPDAMNSLNGEMLAALAPRLQEVAQDPTVRCVVLTGAGQKAFSAGGDVKDMAARGPAAGPEGDPSDGPPPMEWAMDRLAANQEASLLLHEMGKPTVAAINGAVAGASLSLALACDLRIAVEGAAFTTAFAKIGFSGDFGGSWWMTQIVGTAKARELYFLGDRFDAAEALRLGLVHYVVPREKFQSEAKALAERLAAGPPIAYRYMKRNLNFALVGDPRTALRLEAEGMIRTGQTEDFKNAAMAFVKKQTSTFKGR
ncbi:MAG TPA: enoyl-CoA hydratase [Myxococcota bacterium]|jgi:2-(1,2-epoxy-1,2-dihydrophenyl)acetyl-CoA isomerase|nr:enoyl-CoA hydratase [Myxococcota bacterium]